MSKPKSQMNNTETETENGTKKEKISEQRVLNIKSPYSGSVKLGTKKRSKEI